MVSGVEVPSWVGRDLRVGCVVVCGRERERGGEGRREEEERKGKDFSLFYSSNPLKPLRSIPRRSPAGPPARSPPITSHTHHSPTYPSNPDPKVGDPHPPPHPGKGRKKGGKKRTFEAYKPQIFSLGENPQTPPLYWDAQEKDKKSGGARYVDGPDKIDRSHRDEFNRTVRFNVARLPAEIEGGQSWQVQVGCRRRRGGVERGGAGAKWDGESMKFKMREMCGKLACDG